MSLQIYEGTYNTEFPLNFYDDDLSPEATVPSQERSIYRNDIPLDQM